jgi:hypothetical protein
MAFANSEAYDAGWNDGYAYEQEICTGSHVTRQPDLDRYLSDSEYQSGVRDGEKQASDDCVSSQFGGRGVVVKHMGGWPQSKWDAKRSRHESANSE